MYSVIELVRVKIKSMLQGFTLAGTLAEIYGNRDGVDKHNSRPSRNCRPDLCNNSPTTTTLVSALMAKWEPRICQMSCAILAMYDGFVIVSTMVLVARDTRSHVRAEKIGWLLCRPGASHIRLYRRFQSQFCNWYAVLRPHSPYKLSYTIGLAMILSKFELFLHITDEI